MHLKGRQRQLKPQTGDRCIKALAVAILIVSGIRLHRQPQIPTTALAPTRHLPAGVRSGAGVQAAAGLHLEGLPDSVVAELQAAVGVEERERHRRAGGLEAEVQGLAPSWCTGTSKGSGPAADAGDIDRHIRVAGASGPAEERRL
eukprot:scaffold149_cov315-Pinguiococcus_pyrenoidosus.AAC.60